MPKVEQVQARLAELEHQQLINKARLRKSVERRLEFLLWEQQQLKAELEERAGRRRRLTLPERLLGGAGLGIAQGIGELINAADDLDEWADRNLPSWMTTAFNGETAEQRMAKRTKGWRKFRSPIVANPDAPNIGLSGDIARVIGQWAAPAGAFAKGLKGLRLLSQSTTARAAVASTAANFAAFNPLEDRLSNSLAGSSNGAAAAVSEYLKADALNDSSLENRLLQTVESGAIEVMGAGVTKLFVRTVKGLRSLKRGTADAIELERVIAEDTASFTAERQSRPTRLPVAARVEPEARHGTVEAVPQVAPKPVPVGSEGERMAAEEARTLAAEGSSGAAMRLSDSEASDLAAYVAKAGDGGTDVATRARVMDNFATRIASSTTPDDLDGLIASVAQVTAERAGAAAPRTFAETLENASRIAQTDTTVDDFARATAGLDSVAQAAEAVVRASLHHVRDVTEHIAELTAKGADVPDALLAEHIAAQSKAAYLASKVRGSQSEIGRALNSLKIALQAQGTVRTVAGRSSSQGKVGKLLDAFDEATGGESAAAVNRVLDALGSGFTRRDYLDAIKALHARGENPEAIADFIAKLNDPDWADRLIEVGRNGLLSGLGTIGVNVISNSYMALEAPLVRAIAGIGGYVARKSGVAAERTIYVREAAAMLASTTDGLRIGAMSMIHALRTGKPVTAGEAGAAEYAGSHAIRVTRGEREWLEENLGEPVADIAERVANAVGEIVRAPSRVNIGLDEFFRGVNVRAQYDALALRTASAQADTLGLIGAQRETYIRQSFAKAAVPDVETLEAAREYASAQVFMDEPGRLQSAVENLLTVAASHGPVGKIVRFVMVPFARTPGRILKELLITRNPAVGGARAVKALWRVREEGLKALVPGTPEAQVFMAKQVISSAVMLGAASLFLQDRLTGSLSYRDGRRADGRIEYAIRVGDEWVSYNRLDPVGAVLGLTADTLQAIADAGEDAGDEDFKLDVQAAAGGVFLAMMGYALSKSYLQSFADLLDALGPDSGQKGERFLESRLLMFTPYGSALRQVERNMNPELSEAEGLVERLKANLPGLSDDVPRRVDWLGRPELATNTDMLGNLAGVQSRDVRDDPLSSELARLGTEFGIVRRSLGGGVKLSRGEAAAFREVRGRGVTIDGRTLEQELSRLVQSDDYLSLDDDDRIDLIRDTVRDYGMEARLEMRDPSSPFYHPEFAAKYATADNR